MIIHSIIPLEVIFQDNNSGYSQLPIQFEYMGEMVEAVQSPSSSGYIITRVLSTSPKAYLNPALQPGREIGNLGIGQHEK